jgi:hypothetical protein
MLPLKLAPAGLLLFWTGASRVYIVQWLTATIACAV